METPEKQATPEANPPESLFPKNTKPLLLQRPIKQPLTCQVYRTLSPSWI